MNEKILKSKLVPVVVFKTLEDVTPMMDALKQGGVLTAEICFRTECSYDGLVKAIKEYPDMLIGAGTIINVEQCENAINAGAKFIVGPGFNKEIALYCQNKNVDYIPGVVTPTEIMNALEVGLNYLKFFPAGVFGGLKAMDALVAAFPQVKFMPTGGVNLDNLKDYIDKKYIFAVGGSFLMKGDVVNNCITANKIVKGE